jgi:hypothetical protein
MNPIVLELERILENIEIEMQKLFDQQELMETKLEDIQGKCIHEWGEPYEEEWIRYDRDIRDLTPNEMIKWHNCIHCNRKERV